MMTFNVIVLDSRREWRFPLVATLRELGQRIWIARNVGEALHFVERSHGDGWSIVEPLDPFRAVFVEMSLLGGFAGEGLMRAIKELDRIKKWQTFVVGVMDSWNTELACRFLNLDWRLRSPVSLDDASIVIREMTERVSAIDPSSGISRL